jgi:hypothetical protein
MPYVSLDDALSFLALVALRDRSRARRMAIRWLQRWLEETEDANLEQAAAVTDLLAALGGHSHHWALKSLRDMSQEATSRDATRAAV